MNTIAYIIYLFLTWIITIRTGLGFYRNGNVYLLNLFQGDQKLISVINKALLTGYYLLNLGYAAIMLYGWKTVNDWIEVITSVGAKVGFIMITLGVMHFLNMSVLLLFSLQQHSATHKT